MDTGLVLQFWLIAAMLAVTPGADWAYAIAAGLGPRSFVPSIAGMVAGYAAIVVVVALGVGVVVARYPVALGALTIAGAAYLLWLGIGALLRPPGLTHGDARTPAGGAMARFGRGAGVSGINPKGLLLLLALMPQFTSPNGLPPAAQRLVLGALHLLDCAVVYALVALLARRLLRARPRAAVLVSRIAGIAMIGIGGALIVERIAQSV